MRKGFKIDATVINSVGDVFRVLFSDDVMTDVISLDKREVVTAPTVDFEPFTLPAATV